MCLVVLLQLGYTLCSQLVMVLCCLALYLLMSSIWILPHFVLLLLSCMVPWAEGAKWWSPTRATWPSQHSVLKRFQSVSIPTLLLYASLSVSPVMPIRIWWLSEFTMSVRVPLYRAEPSQKLYIHSLSLVHQPCIWSIATPWHSRAPIAIHCTGLLMLQQACKV